jgi:2-dehydropantoate 2-reductase
MSNASPRQILIAGAGAIGCTLAARLAAAGHAVDLLARGHTLATLRQHGVQLDDLDGHWQAPVRAVASAAECATPDMVFLCSKSQDLPALAEQVQPALGPETLVLPLVNGVPFWYFHAEGGRFQGRTCRPWTRTAGWPAPCRWTRCWARWSSSPPRPWARARCAPARRTC